MNRLHLEIADAMSATRPGLTPAEHAERYGYDLGWVRASSRELLCAGCGNHERVPLTCSLTLFSVMAAAFIELHAACFRVAALGRTA